ncbi:MAG: peptide deformylase, partial [Burkholderiales bacterium]
MAILPLVVAPDPRLKQRSHPVETFDASIQKLLDDMLETMYHLEGIGLAAVQVGIHKRILVMDIAQSDGERKPLFVINPTIVTSSEECSVYKEGCLSFPDAFSEVIRPAKVTVNYLD